MLFKTNFKNWITEFPQNVGKWLWRGRVSSEISMFRVSNRDFHNENLFSDPNLLMKTTLRIFIRPIEQFLEFAEKKFSSILKPYMHSLIKNSIKIACKNLNKKLHKFFLHFSFFLIIPMVWKYIQGMGFHLIITVFDFFTSTHWFSIFEKKASFSA